jgi:hypothetical protein
VAVGELAGGTLSIHTFAVWVDEALMNRLSWLITLALITSCGHTPAYDAYLSDHDDCVRLTTTNAEYLECEHWARERLDGKSGTPARGTVEVKKSNAAGVH